MKIEEIKLPESWEWFPAETACGSVRDGTHDTPEYVEAGIPLVTSKNLIDDHICFEKTKLISFEDHKEISKRSGVENGDVLFAMIGTIGNPVVVNTSKIFSIKNVALFKKNEDFITPKYLKFWLESPDFDRWLKPRLRGTTQKFAPLGLLRALPIPLAPLVQQTRIVAEIEKQFSRLDEAVANLKRVKANLKRYKAAVLKAAVEGKLTEEWRKQHPDVEPADKLLERILAERRKAAGKGKYKEPVAPDTSGLPELPAGWVWAKSDQLFSYVTSGSRGWASYYSETGPAFLRMGNLDHDTIYLDLADIQRVTPPLDSEGTRTKVSAGDILVSITADVGMVGLVPDDFEEAYINQHVALARPVCRGNSLFLAWFLASKSGQDQFKELQRGATKVGLGLDDIKAVDVPFPLLAEQHQIVAEVERRLSIVAGAEAQVDANLRRADRLRQSILKQAFSGQLVPQDSNDEPASVLLERIRATQPAPTKESAAHQRKHRAPAPKTGAPSPESLPLVAEAPATYGDAIIARILVTMQPGHEYSRADLADPLGLTTGQWNGAIQELKRRGKVRQVGEKRGAKYELNY